MYDQYETVIGLEVHVQLDTQSKAFCRDDARFGSAPNTHISPISLAYPGTLPRLNRQQVALAVRLGLALGCEINRRNAFDRKNYFYPDLPKGYQITQDRQPICIGGSLEIEVAGEKKAVRIHHIHMEEDAGKLVHDTDARFSLVDLNRAGVPLLEIVTEPDLRSPEEVDAFMTNMRQLVRYLDVSDGNMEQGSMRCDCNVSVRRLGATKLGERCEIKNLNSMRYARRAIEFERRRQIDLLESGGRVSQQTLQFDPVSGATSPLRDKEDAHDYRYFPEPDLLPVELSEAFLDATRKGMPPLPRELKSLFMSATYGLSEYDAQLLTEDKNTAVFYSALCEHTANKKAAANLVINKLLPWCAETGEEMAAFPVAPQALAAFIQLIDEDKVSAAIAYQRLLPALIARPDQSPLALAGELQLIQSSDETFLETLADEVLAAFPDKVADYRKGKKGLMGFFMGEMMRRSKGRAEPKKTTALLERKLAE